MASPAPIQAPSPTAPGGAPVRGVLHELNELAERYPESDLYQFRSLVSGHQYRRVYALFQRYVKPGAHVLDWGAGNGHFSYFLLRAGYRVSAFSFDECPVREWIPEAPFRFVHGDPAEPVALPFPSGSFDAITSIGVLEHVREVGGNEAKSLSEFRRLLRPGGMFVCVHFPNRYSWIDYLARTIPGKHHHAYRYTLQDIEKLVNDAGFELLETSRYGLLPRNFWGRLPGRRSEPLARAWDQLDETLSGPLSGICQNYLFAARKIE